MEKRPKPIWSKEVNKLLIDKDMSKKELAKLLRVNYNQLTSVMSGTVYNANIQNAICEFFGIK